MFRSNRFGVSRRPKNLWSTRVPGPQLSYRISCSQPAGDRSHKSPGAWLILFLTRPWLPTQPPNVTALRPARNWQSHVSVGTTCPSSLRDGWRGSPDVEPGSLRSDVLHHMYIYLFIYSFIHSTNWLRWRNVKMTDGTPYKTKTKNPKDIRAAPERKSVRLVRSCWGSSVRTIMSLAVSDEHKSMEYVEIRNK